jgi:hypothetical protein
MTKPRLLRGGFVFTVCAACTSFGTPSETPSVSADAGNADAAADAIADAGQAKDVDPASPDAESDAPTGCPGGTDCERVVFITSQQPGTSWDGTATSFDCNGWSPDAGAAVGTRGQSLQLGAGWSSDGTDACGANDHRLYCVEK